MYSDSKGNLIEQFGDSLKGIELLLAPGEDMTPRRPFDTLIYHTVFRNRSKMDEIAPVLPKLLNALGSLFKQSAHQMEFAEQWTEDAVNNTGKCFQHEPHCGLDGTPGTHKAMRLLSFVANKDFNLEHAKEITAHIRAGEMVVYVDLLLTHHITSLWL